MAIRRAAIAVLGIILAGLLIHLGYRAFDRTRSHPTVPLAAPTADIAALPAVLPTLPAPAPHEATATFAGGCFWCTEADFEKAPGVTSVISGYTGGTVSNPSYNEVSGETTGHYESVEVRYDPRVISYDALLDWLFVHIDPTDPNGQFADQGPSYKSAIFYRTDAERTAAEDAKKDLAASGVFSKPIATLIIPAGIFYVAEDYHQDYHTKNPVRYAYYRSGSGRDTFLTTYWTDEAKKKYTAIRSAVLAPTPVTPSAPAAFVKPSADTLRTKLTSLQYTVTQEADTEPSFNNAYWNEERAGIYVDIVSGEPLFSSADKFDSGTGWPSFTKPLVPDNIVRKKDGFLFFSRTEIRSAHADSHLGHVFEDGPADKGGLRYCMNSAALRFVPKDTMAAEGYGAYLIGLP